MATVELRKLSKRFGADTWAVDALDLSIAEGEFVVLLGPSGCGKSTTLRMIAGLESPTSGQVLINGQDVTSWAPKNRNVSMVFQNYALYPHMTVLDNMSFALKMRRVTKDQIRSRVERAAAALGISELLRRKPAQLSGGQRQRVALGRALVREPDVFLFDEPLSNLDARLRLTMRSELSQLHRQLKATMIYVTHDQVEAMTLGDRIVVMQDGQAQQSGRPMDVYDQPANRFVAEFLGSPPMNFIPAQAGDGKVIIDSAPPIPLDLAADGPVLLGIRPEDVELDGDAVESAVLEAQVDGVQLLGSEAIVELQWGAMGLLARCDARRQLAAGQTCRVALKLPRLHVFHAASGERLGAVRR